MFSFSPASVRVDYATGMARPLSSIGPPLSETGRRNTSSRRKSSRAVSIGSRSTSRNGRRNSIADSYPRRSFSAEPDAFERGRRALPGNARASRARRWDGNNRSHSDWDSMRRDPELWFPNSDCLIHLYAQGQSQRGASIRVSVADLEASDCMLLFAQAFGSSHPDSPGSRHSSSSEDGGYFTSPRTGGKHELYIPAPSDISRENAFDYHLTTRNFFAWMFDIPLVGTKLGESLIRLQERMNEYRPDPDQNLDDILAYIDSQGYSDFRDCPDHALGILNFAEKFQLAELWTDAFVHCAGMNDSLISSQEFGDVSRTTKALVTRASLEMNVRLERSSISLSTFMEDELSGPYLGLPDNMLKHMERFRSVLHSFYVRKHGYWPPHDMKPTQGKILPLPKHTLLTMYTDFRNLFEFIANQDSTPGMKASADSIYGSVNIAQAVSKFDQRKKFNPLPHSLPLVPVSANTHAESTPSMSIGFFSRIFSHKRVKVEQRAASLAALQEATNVHQSKVISSPLVKEYMRFEREFTTRGEDERVSVADARKSRWLVVYAQLQTLADLTRAPEVVRDIEGVDYPLCCQTAGTPPWTAKGSHGSPSSSDLASAPPLNSSNPSTLNVQQTATPPSESSLPSPTISTTSACPAPLDLDRVATNKRISFAQSTISEAPANNSPPNLSSSSESKTPLPPPPPASDSIPSKPSTNVSTTFLIPRNAPAPAPPKTPTPSKRSRPSTKRTLSDRLTNSTLGLIFAPQPVRPLGAPDELLGEEKFAITKAGSTRPRSSSGGPSLRSSMAGSIRILRTVSHSAANASSVSISENDEIEFECRGDVPDDALLEEEETPVPSRYATPRPATYTRTPGKIDTSASAPPPLSDSPPGLSPSHPPRSGSDGSGSPAASEANTPTSAKFGRGFFNGGAEQAKEEAAPPSPSIYGDDDEPSRFAPSVLDLGGMMGGNGRKDAQELARGWREVLMERLD